MRLIEKFQDIDRRFLYLLLFLCVALPLILPIPGGKTIILPQTQGYYDTIERVAKDPTRKDKLAIVCCNFSASTATENLNQLTATLRHLMRSHIKFAIFSVADPQGRELAQQVAEQIGPEYDYQYGRDFVNWGFKAGDPALNIKSLVRDINGTIGKDIKGTPLGDVPVMKGVTGVDDIAMVFEIASTDTLEYWMAYFRAAGKEPVPTLFACTAVMAPEAFPYLKSGQLQGMLNGLKGAGEYEILIDKPAFASRASTSLSFAHLLILGLIILGNVSMLLARRKGAKA